jgi:hypothetical protein
MEAILGIDVGKADFHCSLFVEGKFQSNSFPNSRKVPPRGRQPASKTGGGASRSAFDSSTFRRTRHQDRAFTASRAIRRRRRGATCATLRARDGPRPDAARRFFSFVHV